jgi:AraC-like DNA-binding protein
LLTKFIYQNFTTTFNDLVNEARVNYFVTLVADGKHPNYTIESLAQLSGFGSRQSLYKQFKKFHGGTPSDLYNSTLR